MLVVITASSWLSFYHSVRVATNDENKNQTMIQTTNSPWSSLHNDSVGVAAIEKHHLLSRTMEQSQNQKMIQIRRRRQKTTHDDTNEQQQQPRPEDFECLFWVQTGNCDPIHGPFEEQKACNETIKAGASGYSMLICIIHIYGTMQRLIL